uniref:FBD domain-containing protein n=1 Tax=Caenorhabditis tropicalis TaxID=1561998 RepID=A0A1I7U8E5_9PELO
MLVESLITLASKKVAEYLTKGYYEGLDMILNETMSDQLFSHSIIWKSSYLSSIFAKESGLKFNLTTVAHNIRMSPKDYECLQFHAIRSIRIGCDDFKDFQEYRIENGDEESRIDIIRILDTCLNESSCEHLRRLELFYPERLSDDWMEIVGKLLPNLQSLICRLPKEESFRRVCMSFPNLIHLDIGFTYNGNLNAIRHLKNLQILVLEGSVFDSHEGLEGLFELQNLRVIEAPYTHGFIENLLNFDRPLMNLRFLVCFSSDITEEELRRVVEISPSLEQIDVFETSCELTDFSEIPVKVVNLGTIESTMRTLRLYSQIHYDYMDTCCDRISFFLENETKCQGFKEEKFLELMMEVFDVDDTEESFIRCLKQFYEYSFPDQSMTNIIKNIDSNTPLDASKKALLAKRKWAAQVVLSHFPEEVEEE